MPDLEVTTRAASTRYWRTCHVYLSQISSGTKLAARMTKKAIQKMFQLNETAERASRTPAKLNKGKRTPSILQ
jgi:hypothetical protein